METETVVSGAAASSRFSTSTFRQKHLREPTEEQRAEKRARKQAVREERRERRQV